MSIHLQKSIVRAAAIAAVCLFSTARLIGDEPPAAGIHTPMIVIPRLDTIEEVAPDLDLAPWTRTARITGFLSPDGNTPATHHTAVHIAWDRKSLYVAFRCEGQTADALTTDITERDGPVWRDDSVEVIVCPPDDARPMFHFIANAAGTYYDAKDLDKAWNADWSVVSSVNGEDYTVAMVIPLEAFHPLSRPKPGDAWRVNFCRNVVGGDSPERVNWSPTISSPHDPDHFGRLVFGDDATPAVRFRHVAPVTIGTNVLQVSTSAPVAYRIAGIDQNHTRTMLADGTLDSDDITYVLDDDSIREVRLMLTAPDGRPLARGAYPMTSPMIADRIARLQAQYDDILAQFDSLPDKLRAAATEARTPLRDAVAVLENPARHTPDNWDRLKKQIADLERSLDTAANYARTLALYPDADFAVGLARPTRKIMIRDTRFAGWIDDHFDLKLARREHEGFQVVVMPPIDDLTNAAVSVSPLRHAGTGREMDGECTVMLVGHVDVDDNTRYAVEHHGWWPDPLLDFQTRCDIRAGEHVAFWIDVAAHADTPPGEYTGQVTIAADRCDPIDIRLNVRVWDFELPVTNHLPNAFTYNEGPVGRFYPDRWDDEMRHRYYDLILDHRLNVDHLYRRKPPAIEVLEYARKKGQNAFNLGSEFRNSAVKPPDSRWDRYLSELEAKGLRRYAYVYGYDEVKTEKFAEMREVFGAIHERYPGIPTMTTAIDRSYGRDTNLRDVVDIWVPLTDWYDLDEARRLRAEGRQVWWYICVVPEHPYANWFIEYPAIEARLLMGAMSHKYETDGVLYYMINLWTGNHRPITSGPYTDWDPGSLVNEKKNYTANGDGSLICPGPHGPLSTIRLENIRDGIEDYEYLYRLAEQAERIRNLPANPARKAWLDRASILLSVPDAIVHDLTRYTRDPEALDRYRDHIAEAILDGAELANRDSASRNPSSDPDENSPAAAFTNPVYEGADPWVTYQDGHYYLCQSEGNLGVAVWKSPKLTDRGIKRVVWRSPDKGWNARQVWAPELHRINGRWYIYYAASDGHNANHRTGVLAAMTDDPQGPYIDKGMLYTGDDITGHTDNRWSIDATPLRIGDRLYLVWSGWPAKDDVQYLYIAPMSNPWTVAGDRVRLCDNDTYLWERVGESADQRGLNEGPQVLDRGDRIFLVYSCSGSWEPTYKLAMLSMDRNADPLDPSNWTRHDQPVFTGNQDVFGVGHASFTKSPDGTEDWIVYHSKLSREHGWQRTVSIQPFTWTPEGLPDFGRPLPPGKVLPAPSGEKPNRPGTRFSDAFGHGRWDRWNYFGYTRFIRIDDGVMHLGGHPEWGMVNHYRAGEKALVRGLDWSDCIVESRVRVEDGDRDAGLLFRVQYPAVGYDAQRGYFAGVIPASGKVVLGRTDGARWHELALVDHAIEPHRWYNLRVEAVGTRIRVFVDDALKIDVTDDRYDEGMVGVRVVDTHAAFDDFSVGTPGDAIATIPEEAP